MKPKQDYQRSSCTETRGRSPERAVWPFGDPQGSLQTVRVPPQTFMQGADDNPPSVCSFELPNFLNTLHRT